MIKMKVRGISLPFELNKEERTIYIKAIPLAPKRPFSHNNVCKIAVKIAVIIVITNNFLVPYFSSIKGPKSKIIDKFPKRCITLE